MLLSLFYCTVQAVLAVRLATWLLALLEERRSSEPAVYIQLRDGSRKFAVSLLSRRSRWFRESIAQAQRVGRSTGQYPHDPIVLDEVPVHAFDWLIEYLMGEPHDGPTRYTVEGLICVLELSHQYQIPSGIAFASEELDQHPDFDSASKLRLASTIRMPQSDTWFRDAAMSLLSPRKDELSPTELRALGRLFHDVTTARARVQRRRLGAMVSKPPHVNSVVCNHPLQCAFVWHSLCEAYVSRLWKHPEYPLHDMARWLTDGELAEPSCDQCRGHLLGGTMCGPCLQASRDAVIASGALEVEDGEIEEAVKQLTLAHLHT